MSLITRMTGTLPGTSLTYIHSLLHGWGARLELGVYEGRSINFMAKLDPDWTYHGFDSFEGLPEEWSLGRLTMKKRAFNMRGTSS